MIGDEELDTLVKATIAGGGVIPHIHKSLMNKGPPMGKPMKPTGGGPVPVGVPKPSQMQQQMPSQPGPISQSMLPK